MVERMCSDQSNKFVRGWENKPYPKRPVNSIRVFLSLDEMIHLLTEGSVKGKQLINIDTAFGAVNGGYMTAVTVRHPMFVDQRTNMPVEMVGAIMLSTDLLSDSYKFLGEQLKTWTGASDSQSVFAFVTDADSKLLKGLKECTLFKNATHVLCEIHGRKNCEMKMDKCGFTLQDQAFTNREIWGKDQLFPDGKSRFRVPGLVDCKTEVEFAITLQTCVGHAS